MGWPSSIQYWKEYLIVLFSFFLQKDNGGPLVCQEHERKVIIGVSIQRTKCASSQPALFVNVAFYSEWIYKVFKLYPSLETNWWRVGSMHGLSSACSKERWASEFLGERGQRSQQHEPARRNEENNLMEKCPFWSFVPEFIIFTVKKVETWRTKHPSHFYNQSFQHMDDILNIFLTYSGFLKTTNRKKKKRKTLVTQFYLLEFTWMQTADSLPVTPLVTGISFFFFNMLSLMVKYIFLPPTQVMVILQNIYSLMWS